MCYYKLYVFLHCGHSTFSDMPVGFCKAAKDVSARFSGSSVISRADSMDVEERTLSETVSKNKEMRPCNNGRIHPLQTIRLDRLCAACQYERDARLKALESLNSEIHFEPSRWQFKYQGGTSMRQTGPTKEAVSRPESGITWDVATTLNNLLPGGQGWMRDWRRQGAGAAE